jgi:hypothetical protein
MSLVNTPLTCTRQSPLVHGRLVPSRVVVTQLVTPPVAGAAWRCADGRNPGTLIRGSQVLPPVSSALLDLGWARLSTLALDRVDSYVSVKIRASSVVDPLQCRGDDNDWHQEARSNNGIRTQAEEARAARARPYRDERRDEDASSQGNHIEAQFISALLSLLFRMQNRETPLRLGMRQLCL